MKIYNCKHCGKEFTDANKLRGHSTHCKENPNRLKTCNFNLGKGKKHKKSECNCEYCNKLLFSSNSLRQHEKRCKLNPNRIKSGIEYYNESEHVVWNKGLTAQNNKSIEQQSKTLKSKYKSGELIPHRKGTHHSEEQKYKQRISTLKYLENIKSGFTPRYNINACKYIDELNKMKGWNLQHAENGGEIKCFGYFLDGYDENLNIVFEYDEPNHYVDVYNNILTDKDLIRQQNIINKLNCEFWRYNERLNLLYRVN